MSGLLALSLPLGLLVGTDGGILARLFWRLLNSDRPVWGLGFNAYSRQPAHQDSPRT
jgi:hypothetical protein